MPQPLDYEVPLVGVKPRRPLLELLALALPTIAQMASYTVMQFIDTWMLTRVSDQAALAAGNAGMWAMTLISLGMGTLWVVNTLVSQHFGQRDYAACGRYLWQGVWFAVGYGLLIVLLLPFAGGLFERLGHEPRLVRMEVAYLQITGAASVVKLVASSFQQFLLAVNRPVSVLVGSVVGVGANIVAAVVLIFGALGAPKLGLVGAAWAQNIGVTVEMGVVIALALRPEIRRTFNVLDRGLRAAELWTLLRVGVPSGLQFVADILAWTLFGQGVMARFGNTGMTSTMFIFRYMSVSFMPAIGIGIAVTALVGRYIGMGRPDTAERRAHLGFVVVAAYMLTCGVGFYLGRFGLIRLFSDEPELIRQGSVLMVFAAVYQLFDACYITYNGALRGAGDTFVPAVATAGLNWGITVGGGYAIALCLPQLGPAGPWLAATVYGIILGVYMLVRFVRGAWRAIRLDGSAGDDRVPQAVTG